MKTSYKVLGALWMVICAYFFATRVQGIYELPPDRLDTLAINVFFIVLWLGGMFVSLYVLTGARWARIALSAITLLTMAGSVMGLFAYFNYDPYSPAGIGFDVFAAASAGVLLFVRSHSVA